MKLSKDIQNKMFYVAGIIILIYIMKPSLIFKPNGEHREYGLGYDKDGYKKSIYTMQLMIVLIVVMVYMLM
jgi:hypothetical protein